MQQNRPTDEDLRTMTYEELVAAEKDALEAFAGLTATDEIAARHDAYRAVCRERARREWAPGPYLY